MGISAQANMRIEIVRERERDRERAIERVESGIKEERLCKRLKRGRKWVKESERGLECMCVCSH